MASFFFDYLPWGKSPTAAPPLLKDQTYTEKSFCTEKKQKSSTYGGDSIQLRSFALCSALNL
jgi:hypothetical protein